MSKGGGKGDGLLQLLLGGGGGRSWNSDRKDDIVDPDDVGQDRSKWAEYKRLMLRVRNGLAELLFKKNAAMKHMY